MLGESLGAGGGGKDGKPRAAAVAGKRGASVAVGGVAGRGGTSLAKELLVFSTVSQSVSGCRCCQLLLEMSRHSHACLQLLETGRPYLTGVLRVPSLQTALMLARRIDASRDCSRLLVDRWLLYELKGASTGRRVSVCLCTLLCVVLPHHL